MNATSFTSDLQLQLVKKLVEQIHDGSIMPGEHLREIELSKEFSVSRTPLRAALNYLKDHGLVEKKANLGFFVSTENADVPIPYPSLPKTDDEKIKELIAQDWFNGKIKKAVSEGEVQSRYGLGRLKAQRILNSLSQQDIVSRLPGYGWQFNPTLNSLKAHDESYEYRLILEPAAICSPKFVYSVATGETLRQRHQTVLHAPEEDLTLAELFQLDADFHSFVAECSGNRYVVQSIDKQNQLRRLLEYNSLVNAGRLRASCMEHLEIIHYLSLEKNDIAAKLMKAHLEKGQLARPDF